MSMSINKKIYCKSKILFRLLINVEKSYVDWGLLSIIILFYIYRTLFYLDNNSLTPDAITTYLPFAQKVINQGFSFFSTAESLNASPLSYLWVALFQADVSLVRYVNLILGIFMVILIYKLGRQLHSSAVGLVAAFLFARSQLLIPWIPTLLSEPTFYFFTLLWFWAIGEVIANKRWAIPVAATALTLSILARSIWFYPALIFIFLSTIWFFISQSNRELAKRIVIANSIGLILPVSFIIKNYIVFSAPVIAFGSGFALYAGTNLMTSGFEPYYLGTGYGGSLDHLSLIGDREHSLVALEFLKDRSVIDLISWFLQKLQWTLFFSPLDIPYVVSLWRTLEISFATIAICWGINKNSLFVKVLTIGFLIQLFQTAFALYNTRYSADNLEFLLILLSAVGIVISFSGIYGTILSFLNMILKKSSVKILPNTYPNVKYGVGGLLLFLILIIYLGFRTVPILHLPNHIPVTTLFKLTSPIIKDSTLFFNDSELDEKKFTQIDTIIHIKSKIVPNEPDYPVWTIKMSLSSRNNGLCKNASLNFYSVNGLKSSAIYFDVKNDGSMNIYNIGAGGFQKHLFPETNGKIVLSVYCTKDVNILVNQVSLVVPHMVEYYWSRIIN